MKLGNLESVTYSTRKGNEPITHYIHHFGEGRSRKPMLAADPDSKRLHVVGGGYTITRAGIEG